MNDMTLNWYKSIKNRTSVREFSDTVDQKTFTELKKFAAGLNNDEARLVLRSKDGVLKSIFLAYGRVAGTKGFAAPEQYGLSQSDGRADIYALGVLLNIMLTGEHPSRKLAGGRMGRIVQRCTRVNPEKRYKNILHLMEAL